MVGLAGRPSQAPALASAVNIGAFDLAHALGSLLAGLTIEAGHGSASPAWIGTGLGLVGLAVTGLVSLRVRHQAVRADADQQHLEDGSAACCARGGGP